MRKYRDLVIAILLFIVLDLSILVFNFFAANQFERDANRINAAGELRMLTQQITKSLLTLHGESNSQMPMQTSMAQLGQGHAGFERALAGLQQMTGDDLEFAAMGLNADETRRRIGQVEREWRPLGESILPVIGMTEPATQDIEIAVTKAVARNIRLMGLCDDLANSIEAAAKTKANRMRQVQVMAIVLALLNFVYIVFKFLRRLDASDRVAETARQETEEILSTVGEGLLLVHADGRIGGQFSASVPRLFDREVKAGQDFDQLLVEVLGLQRGGEAARLRKRLFEPDVEPALLGQLDALREVPAMARHGGPPKYLTFQMTQVREGDAVKDLLVTVLDVTEKVRLEHTLASLINSISDLIFYKDREGRYLGCNAAYAALVGKPVHEIRGKTCRDLFPQEVAMVMEEHDRISLRELREQASEHWASYPDGTRVMFHTVVSPLSNSHDGPQGLLGISRDITQRKKIEEEIRRAKAFAEEATRMKSDFLANMSHEIRTPMNAIIGLSHLALKTELSVRQRDYIQKVQSSGQHLLGIVNDILDFSKVEAGKIDLESVDFDLEKLLDGTTSVIGEKCHAKGLELVLDVASGVPSQLIGDPLRVRQVLLNYAGNAVKFTERGEVVVSVRVAERTESDVLLRFCVRDSGIGLTSEQMGRLFQSFSQADTSTSRKFGGTGLGLAISKKLAELMGGEVGVTSDFGQGSSFWFTARFRMAQGPKRKLALDPGLQGLRALVVDDNAHARAVALDMLRGMAFTAAEADCGARAIEEVRRAAAAGEPYDIVYLDWRMPGMDGIETARRIRSIGLHAPPMLLMVTAQDRDEVMRDARLVGIEKVLVKPVTPSTLFDMTISMFGAWRGVEASVGPGSAVDKRLAPIRGRRILLVEDNDINQLVAGELLRDAGLVVEVADNGEAALALLEKVRYDLVFMDMQMPVMDGVTATRMIRSDKRLELLPVIAMTANAMEQDRRKCLDAGMDDFLAKPLDPDELWTILLRWLNPARGTVRLKAQASVQVR
ncbi:response regulator [Caenimonas soli]|uniref:response regulator n=1 Tax=Caenimonas soli TaxID=2735555 RepID=UPI0015555217|nr:response regulator [Caenimonas soli]